MDLKYDPLDPYLGSVKQPELDSIRDDIRQCETSTPFSKLNWSPSSKHVRRQRNVSDGFVPDFIDSPLVPSKQRIPRPGPGEISVRVHATGLIQLDRKLRNLGVFSISSRLPVGIDVTGEVVEHSPRPSNTHVPASYPAVGTKALFQGNLRRPRDGGLASFVLANAECLIPVPETISVVEAATLVINPFTAALSLFHQSGLDLPFPGTDPTLDYRNAHVVVLGAGTTIGSLIVRLAPITGIGTIVTTSSESSFAPLRALGATHIIDRLSSSIAATVASILGPFVINVVEAYTSGRPTLAVSLFEVCGAPGSIVMLACSTGADTAALADKGISLRNVYGSFDSHPVLFQLCAAALPKWLSTGDMVVLPQRVVEVSTPKTSTPHLTALARVVGLYVVKVHVDDGYDDDGEEARDI